MSVRDCFVYVVKYIWSIFWYCIFLPCRHLPRRMEAKMIEGEEAQVMMMMIIAEGDGNLIVICFSSAREFLTLKFFNKIIASRWVSFCPYITLNPLKVTSMNLILGIALATLSEMYIDQVHVPKHWLTHAYHFFSDTYNILKKTV